MNHRDLHLPRPIPTMPGALDRPTTATLPAGRAARGPTQPNDPPSVTPCSDPWLPATKPATAAKHYAEPHAEEAMRTGSR